MKNNAAPRSRYFVRAGENLAAEFSVALKALPQRPGTK